jgi:hypothetical protein
MHFQVRAEVVSEGAVFEAIVTACAGAPAAHGWSTLPTVVMRDGEPVAGVVWTCCAADTSDGFLHAVAPTACHRRVFDRLTEALRDARPRTRVMADVRVPSSAPLTRAPSAVHVAEVRP